MNRSLHRLAPAAVGAVALLSTVLVGTASAHHVCGQTITQSAVLHENVGPCPNNGLVIGADNITLDLGGFTVFGTAGVGDGIGIEVNNRTGVTVRNGQVTRFDGGVVIAGGSGNTVNRILAQDNIGNRLHRNVTRGNGFHDEAHARGGGIVVGASSTLVTSNVSESNAASGVRVDGQSNTLRLNRATNNGLSVNQGTIDAGGGFDLHDTTPACDANVWQDNTYGTRNQPCID